MTNTYNAPFKEEILSYNGQPIAVFRAVNPDTQEIIIPKMALELVSDIIQEANGITAPQLNNMNGKINSNSELIATLMLLAELKDDIRSTGNDNLEVFGISDAARIGVLNNHSDFSILSAEALSGVTSIQVFNNNGLIYNESIVIAQRFIDHVGGYAGTCLYAKSIWADKFVLSGLTSYSGSSQSSSYNIYLEDGTVYVTNNYPTDLFQSFAVGRDWIFSYVPNNGYICRRPNNTTLSASSISAGYCPVYDDENDRFVLMNMSTLYYYKLPATDTGNLSTSSKAHGLSSLSGRVIEWTKYDVSSYLGCFSPFSSVAGFNSFIRTLDNFNTVTKIVTNIPSNDGNNLQSIESFNSKIWVVDSVLHNLYSTQINNYSNFIIESEFENEYVTKIKVIDGILWVVGHNSLLKYSSDGVNFVQINLNVGDGILSFKEIEKVNGKIAVFTVNAIYYFSIADVMNMKGKRYMIDTEKVLIVDVSTNGETANLTLNEPLSATHSLNSAIKRTSHSDIPPNSTQTVCVELQNMYSHNGIVAIPTFTKVDNVSVICEIGVRNSKTGIEEWITVPMVKEILQNDDGWHKQTYYIVLDSYYSIFAISFTVTNNSETVIELYSLGIGLSNEVYELGGE